jgi:hypothetical protein
MVETQYRCQNEHRRMAVRRSITEDGVPLLNSIDYLELSVDRQILLLYCIHPLTSTDLTPDNIQIEATDRLRGDAVTVESIDVIDNLITMGVRATFSPSIYHLRLIDPISSRLDRKKVILDKVDLKPTFRTSIFTTNT